MNKNTRLLPRSSGLLLHLASLPGTYGIGDIGCEQGQPARELTNLLAEAGQTFWQVLPIGPTGFADSPYQSFCSFAGNTNLISLDTLELRGWLTKHELNDRPFFSTRNIDYASIITWHNEMLTIAYERFVADGGYSDTRFQKFLKDNSVWLGDFALFMVLKEENEGKAWVEWPEEDSMRTRERIDQAQEKYRWRLHEHMFLQWVFFEQWSQLKAYAGRCDIKIIGDIPIYVAHDSCDVWVNLQNGLFDIDSFGNLRSVAGVPPDYYSETGQRWGNPIYLWNHHEATNYAWWKQRIEACLRLFDLIRIDHFRCVFNYWQIDVDQSRAVNGRWRRGPRDSFLSALGENVRQRIIAEDLGDAMDPVRLWKDKWGIPGMKVLQFAFGGKEEDRRHFMPVPYDPNGHGDNTIMYTSTQDSNTAVGWWFSDSSPEERSEMTTTIRQCKRDEQYEIMEPNWDLIELGMKSDCRVVIVPIQDMLGLGPSARMNKCGRRLGNWRWRCTAEQLAEAPWQRLAALTRMSDRWRKSS